MRSTYRAWVESGAQGFFLTPDIPLARLVIASERALQRHMDAPGYLIERLEYDPATDGVPQLADQINPAGSASNTGHLGYRGRKRVERAEEAVAEGWLMWETEGDVVRGAGVDHPVPAAVDEEETSAMPEERGESAR